MIDIEYIRNNAPVGATHYKKIFKGVSDCAIKYYKQVGCTLYFWYYRKWVKVVKTEAKWAIKELNNVGSN